MANKVNIYALESKLRGALTTVRHEFELTNKELFPVLFDTVIDKFIPQESDRRTKLAKEKERDLAAFHEAARRLIKYMN